MADVFGEAESDLSSIESSSSEDEQEEDGDDTSTSDDDVDDGEDVGEEGEVREKVTVGKGSAREEGDERPEVELDENNSTRVNKSNSEKVESTGKHVAVKPEARTPKWNNQRLFPPSSKCRS